MRLAALRALHAVRALIIVLALYRVWRCYIGQVPILHGSRTNKRTAAAIRLLRTMRYHCTPWLINGCMTTIWSSFFRTTPKINFRREIVELSDGGTVALDWTGCATASDTAPTLLILHGLTGGSHEAYVRHLVLGALARSWCVVVMNARGCGGNALRTPMTFTAARTADLRHVVTFLREGHSSDASASSVARGGLLFAAGFSLGAGILGKFVGEEGAAGRKGGGLDAAVLNSAPFDLNHEAADFWLFSPALCHSLQDWLRRNEAPFRLTTQHGIDLPSVYASKTVREFDQRAVVPLMGYRDVEHYYRDASTKAHICHACIPVLALNSLDDPVCAGSAVPATALAATNEHVVIALTQEGGHVHFPQGWWPRNQSWSDDVTLAFLEEMQV